MKASFKHNQRFWAKIGYRLQPKFGFFSVALSTYILSTFLLKFRYCEKATKFGKTSYFFILISNIKTKCAYYLYYLFNIIYIYSCTGWMLLPKRYRFISFSINIFVVVAESQMIGKIISFRYRNSQVGYMWYSSWGILKLTFLINTDTYFLLK